MSIYLHIYMYIYVYIYVYMSTCVHYTCTHTFTIIHHCVSVSFWYVSTSQLVAATPSPDALGLSEKLGKNKIDG